GAACCLQSSFNSGALREDLSVILSSGGILCAARLSTEASGNQGRTVHCNLFDRLGSVFLWLDDSAKARTTKSKRGRSGSSCLSPKPCGLHQVSDGDASSAFRYGSGSEYRRHLRGTDHLGHGCNVAQGLQRWIWISAPIRSPGRAIHRAA